MPPADDAPLDLTDFSGTARLFPLPNLVLFPHVLQLLHVFEPRYRELLESALAGDRLIAMALLAPGWESDYEGRPALHPMACLGHITSSHRLDDGRYNLLLAGVKRARIVRELPAEKSYREAVVELCHDEYPEAETNCRGELQRQLLAEFRRWMPSLGEAEEQLEQLLCRDVSLGMLTDLVSYTLQIDVAQKQRLLGECNVDRRARDLLGILQSGPEGDCQTARWFPPDFSPN